jgi:hypothetical protein
VPELLVREFRVSHGRGGLHKLVLECEKATWEKQPGEFIYFICRFIVTPFFVYACVRFPSYCDRIFIIFSWTEFTVTVMFLESFVAEKLNSGVRYLT